MVQRDLLQKALRRSQFQRYEAQIRSELGGLLEREGASLRFIDWDRHDLMIDRVNRYRTKAAKGLYPTGEREWSLDEASLVQGCIMLLADKLGDRPAFLYIPRYFIAFVPYSGWQTCEVAMIHSEAARDIIEKALYLLDWIDYFEIIFNQGKESASFDKSSLVEYDRNIHRAAEKTLYHIQGWGKKVTGCLSCCTSLRPDEGES